MKHLFRGLLAALLLTVPALGQSVGGGQPVYQNWFVVGTPTTSTITTASSAHAFPSAGPTARICNQGTVDVFVNAQGTSNGVVATSLSSWVKAGTCQNFNLKPFGTQYTYWAGIAASSTASVYVEAGLGAPSPFSSAASSGGGGGAVTIAGGADVSEGTIGDTHTTGTVVGFLKDVYTALTTGPVPVSSATLATVSAQNTGNTSLSTIAVNSGLPLTAPGTPAATAVTVQGNASGVAVPVSAGSLPLPTGAASAANQSTALTSLATIATNTTSSGTPTDVADGSVTGGTVGTKSQLGGGQYNSTVPTLTNAQQAALQVDSNGGIVTAPYSIKAGMVRGSGSGTDTAAHTILAASGSASLKTYVTAIQCSNSSASSTIITFNDGASSQLIVPAGGGNNVVFPIPLVTAANTVFSLTSGTSVTTAICNAQGYFAP